MRLRSDRSGRGSHPGARLRNAAAVLASAAALLTAGATAAAAAAPMRHTQSAAAAAARFRHACAKPAKKLTMQCMVLINTAVPEQPASAFAAPTAQADLSAYRSQYGLPACGAGCFTKVNQNGAASPLPPAAGSNGWDVEEATSCHGCRGHPDAAAGRPQ